MEMSSRRRRARNENCGATGETSPTNVARRAAPTTTSSSIVPERMGDARGGEGGLEGGRVQQDGAGGEWQWQMANGGAKGQPNRKASDFLKLTLNPKYKRNHIPQKYFIVKFLVKANKVIHQIAAAANKSTSPLNLALAFQLCTRYPRGEAGFPWFSTVRQPTHPHTHSNHPRPPTIHKSHPLAAAIQQHL